MAKCPIARRTIPVGGRSWGNVIIEYWDNGELKYKEVSDDSPLPVTAIASTAEITSRLDTLLLRQDEIITELQSHNTLLQAILAALES